MLITRVWHDEVPEPEDQAGRSTSPREERSADEPISRSHATPVPIISVVLVAHADQVRLTRALEALATQTFPPAHLEVIVVCPSAQADAPRLVATLARRRPGLRLRFVTCDPQRGPAAARNCGWRRATGSIVGFTTDEVIPSPAWVASAARAFHPVVDVVGGQVVVPEPARPSLPVRRAVERLQVPWTAHNVFYRRSLLEALGGFDERYSPCGHDDTDLMLATLGAGARFCAAEGAVVVHSRTGATWRDELSRQVLHADEALLYRKHPDLYTQYVRPAAPLADYAALASLAALTVSLVAHRRALAGASAAALAALTLIRVREPAAEVWDRPRDFAALLLASALLPPVTAGMRLFGALKHRVWFF